MTYVEWLKDLGMEWLPILHTEDDDGKKYVTVQCSRCGFRTFFKEGGEEWPYCPDCERMTRETQKRVFWYFDL